MEVRVLSSPTTNQAVFYARFLPEIDCASLFDSEHRNNSPKENRKVDGYRAAVNFNLNLFFWSFVDLWTCRLVGPPVSEFDQLADHFSSAHHAVVFFEVAANSSDQWWPWLLPPCQASRVLRTLPRRQTNRYFTDIRRRRAVRKRRG